MADISITFDTKFDGKNLGNALKSLGQQFESTEKTTKKFDSTQKKAFASGVSGAKSMKNAFSGVARALTGMIAAVGFTSLIKQSTMAAMAVESSMDNIKYTMKDSSAYFDNWVNTQAKAFAVSTQDAYKYGSTYSNLVSSFTKDTGEIAKGTTDLIEATAVIASKTGRSFDDVADRIRSGMLGSTEAIEDLGIYTQVSMLESTEAFKKFAGDQSWNQLDFQTQQQIRNMAILEQATSRYGTELADTTQTRHAQFMAGLKNIQLSLGQAFLPIYDFILPALTRMTDGIVRALTYFKAFTTALFGNKGKVSNPFKGQGEEVQKNTSSMGEFDESVKKSEKSAKKLKKSLQGFDQLNVMQSNEDSSPKTPASSGAPAGIGDIGGGGGVPQDLNMGLDQAEVDEITKKAEAAAEKFKNTITKIKDTIVENKGIILFTLGVIGTAIAGVFTVQKLSGIVNFASGLAKSFGGIVTTMKGLGTALGTALGAVSLPAIAIAAVIALVVLALIDLWKNNEEFRDRVKEMWANIADTLKKIWDSIIKPILDGLIEMFISIYENGIKPLWNSFKNFIAEIVYLVADLVAVLKPIFDWLIETLGPIIAGVFKGLFIIIAEVVNLLLKIFAGFFDALTLGLKGIREGLRILVDFLKRVFATDWAQVWDSVKKVFKNVWDSLVNIAKAPINAIIDMINKMVQKVFDGFNAMGKAMNKLKFDIPDWVPVIGGGSFGINLPMLDAPQIPRLAKGGLIQPRKPRPVIVGDNMVEDEIVSPVSTMREAVKAELENFGLTSGNREIIQLLTMLVNIQKEGQVIQVGDREFARTVQKSLSSMAMQSGKKII